MYFTVLVSYFYHFPHRDGGHFSLSAAPGSAVSYALPCACGRVGCVAALSSPRPARLPDLPLSESFTGALSPNCNSSTDTTEATRRPDPQPLKRKVHRAVVQNTTQGDTFDVVHGHLYITLFTSHNLFLSNSVRSGFNIRA